MNRIICVVTMIICLQYFTNATSYCQKLFETTWTESTYILGGSALLMGGSLIIDKNREPLTVQRLSALDRSTINSFDRNATLNFSTGAASSSDHLQAGLYLAPMSLFFSNQERKNTKEILIIYSEVFALNGALTSITKSAIGRHRPYAYNNDAPLDLKLTVTTRKSFFSGHTSNAASL